MTNWENARPACASTLQLLRWFAQKSGRFVHRAVTCLPEGVSKRRILATDADELPCIGLDDATARRRGDLASLWHRIGWCTAS